MFTLHLEPHARQDLADLDAPVRQRLAKRLDWLVEHIDEIQPEALTGKWSGYFKFRVGDYRAIYQVEHSRRRINIYRIRHRRQVY